jgi:hypothetical protein
MGEWAEVSSLNGVVTLICHLDSYIGEVLLICPVWNSPRRECSVLPGKVIELVCPCQGL